MKVLLVYPSFPKTFWSFSYALKFIGKKAVSFEKAERMIMHVLYQQNLQEQFKKWVKLRKEESEIRIYMKNYIKT